MWGESYNSGRQVYRYKSLATEGTIIPHNNPKRNVRTIPTQNKDATTALGLMPACSGRSIP